MSMDRTEIGVRGNTQLRRPVDDYIESDFYAPLTDSLITTRGRGLHTYTRATAAWSFDNEGKLNLNIPSGCPRFTGARFVRNLVPASENVQNAGWTKGNLTAASATELVENGATATHQCSSSITLVGDVLLRADVKRGSGTTRHIRLEISGTDGGRANFNVDTGDVTSTANIASGVLLGSGSAPSSAGYRTFWILVRIPTSQTLGFYASRFLSGLDGAISYTGDTTSSFHVTNVQIENVSGQADQTPSEYVSVGVLSSPYHGAGVDGCKWFPTNKDGSAIPSSTLEGYLAEPQRTNNCLWGRDLIATVSNGTVKPWKYSSGDSISFTNGDFSTNDLTGWTNTSSGTGSANASTGSCVLTGTDASNRGSIEHGVTTVIGKQYNITFSLTITSGSCGVGIHTIPSQASGYSIITGVSGAGQVATFTATATTTYIKFWTSLGSSTIDDVSINEAAIQVTTTTGLDNVADSASRLTAIENDATILQLLTAATGTRTLSAYIKRVSGSGTISLTRDGGTGWTDITSSLVTGSWVLVQMTSDVGANPTVGIKMGTSGDVIDVDCVQDENGAWATSPILTTTAAVTRNADVLSYASAFDVSQGSALCSVQSPVPISSGQDQYALNGDSSNARLLYWTTAVARNSIRSYDGVTTAQATGLDITTAIRKRAVKWGSELEVAADGNIGTPVAFDGSMGIVGTLYVGSLHTGISQLSGTIRDVHIWSTPLTDAQLQQVTR